MKVLIHILGILVSVVLFVGCGHSQKEYDRILTDAERLVNAERVDSALTLLGDIDLADLKHDSLQARHIYTRALAHMYQNHPMETDSLIGKVYGYYRGKDMERDITSGTVFAYYKFWIGDTHGAIALLDSILALPDVPQDLTVKPLRIRTLLGTVEYQGERNIPYARRLVSAEPDPLRQAEAKYLLANAYEYAEKSDSALMLLDGLIDYAKSNRLGEKQFQFEMDRAQLLSELGQYDESDAAIDEIFRKAPGNGATHYLLLQRAMNAFNQGNNTRAVSVLAQADSVATGLRQNENAYYMGFSRLLRTMIDYKAQDRLKISHIATVTNRQQERFNRMKASQWESERRALEQQSRVLALKVESGHKTVIILTISFAALLIAVVAVGIIRKNRRRQLESEERAEALQAMVDELQNTPLVSTDSDSKETLRRAMLQQLGIVKMVAETPTEQNREMLRRISAIDAEIGDNMVNWKNIYDIIDNLYGNFYTQLHSKYAPTLTDKEEQIIVLMVAGFSTKEIAVVTVQSAATIYVRKTSIRHKLGIAEKEDIVAGLRQILGQPTNR